MKKLNTLLAFTALCTLSVINGASATDLREVLAHTYNTNPTLLAERETLKTADEQYNQAFSGWLPTASLNLERQHQDVKVNNRAPADSSVGTSRDFRVNQPVFNGGETIAQINRAKNQIKAAQETLKRTEQTMFLDAITAYMDVIRTEEVLRLSQKNAEVLKKHRASTDQRFQLGEVTRTDVAQANARVSRAITDQTRALGEATVARATFKNVTGMDALSLTPPEEAPGTALTLETAISMATTNNPSVKLAEYNVLAAKNNVSISKAVLLPDVSLQGEIRNTDGFINLGGGSYDTQTATINVAVPLYQSGVEYSRIRANKNTVDRRKSEAQAVTRDVIESTTRSWENLEVARATLISTSDAVSAATTAMEGVSQETEVGSRTVLDLLDAEQELFAAQTESVRAKSTQIIASYSLKSAQGELTASGLNLPVEIYDPNVHLSKTKYRLIGF